ncbi:hypothetical protein niasHT_006867 [Heterodera trifolii]|uniref:Major facilitator superfamily (MFS) profile domain-containing protein n=1 Tax=Heterodera trifolii TaxID=157864 RepID=A0ABD2LMG1_9BILA
MDKNAEIGPSLVNVRVSLAVPNCTRLPSASDHSESFSSTLFLSLISWSCALGGLLFGYGTSIISDSLHFMTADLRLNTFSQGITTASLFVGAAFGALAAGKAADLFGRRRAMVTLCFLFIIGNLCSSLAPNFPLLLSARIFLGFSIGGFSSVVPIFLSELSPSPIRAQIVTRNSLNVVTGQLLAFVVGALLGSVWEERLDIWRWMNAVSLFPALLLLSALLLFVPESPRWLVSCGQMDSAFVVLCQIRPNAEEAREELAEIEQSQAERSGKEKLTFWAFLWERWLRNCVMTGLGIALSQQIVGVAAPMYYGTNILERCGMDIELAMIANVSIGVVSVVSMAFGLWLIGRCSRRPILLVGMVGSSLSHLLVALIFWLMPSGNAKGAMVLLLLLLFCAFMQSAITSVTIDFPLRVRGITMGLCIAIIWVTKFAYGLFLPLAMDFLGISATFLLLLFFTALSTIFVRLFLPETRDKTLEEMEKQVLGRSVKSIDVGEVSKVSMWAKCQKYRCGRSVKSIDVGEVSKVSMWAKCQKYRCG